MTKLGKALVVFVTVMSLAFAAFIGVAALGGPNWEARSQEMSDYSFKRTGGEAPSWEVVYRPKGENVGSKPSLPEAISEAQRHKKQLQAEQTASLTKEIAAVKAAAEQEENASKADAEGVKKRLESLHTALGDLESQVAELTRQGTEAANTAERTRSAADARRTDVERLKSELLLVRVDRFRILEQIEQLEQRLTRMDGQILRADRRASQLEASETTEDYSPQPNP